MTPVNEHTGRWVILNGHHEWLPSRRYVEEYLSGDLHAERRAEIDALRKLVAK